MNAARKPVVVLISGRGSNMRALIEHSREPDSPYQVTRVLSDRADATGLRVARDLGVGGDTLALATDGSKAPLEAWLTAAIDAEAPALIVLAGFMRILSRTFVDRYAGRLMNIHPSLLPQYPGLHTHQRVLAAGDRVHGATVHYVTPELDAGPPVIQARVPVLPGDDEARLAARVQTAEHAIYPLAVAWHAAGRLSCQEGRAWLDGSLLEAPVRHDASAS